MIPPLELWPNMAKVVPSPHEVEQALLGTNLLSLIFASLSYFKIISYEGPNIGDIQTERI